MNVGQTRMRLVQAGVAFTAVALIAGCGSAYRSVVTSTTTSGPASVTTSYLAVVSAPSATANGVATLVDYSGDTIMAEANLGVLPYGFALDQSGSEGYTWNADNTLTSFPISTSSLETKNVEYSTMETTSGYETGFYAPTASGLWGADLKNSTADIYTSSPPTYKQSVPVAAVPVMVIGAGSSAERFYAVSQVADSNGYDCNNTPSSVSTIGKVTPIELTSYTADTAITVGTCPVFAVIGSGNQRVFVLNRGNDTISVINSTTGALDSCTSFTNQSGQKVTCHPTLPLSTKAVTATGITPPNGTSGMTSTAGPVFAEYNTATQQLIVSNYDGGTISIIDVSLDEYGNDSNTYDSNGNVTGGFGTTYTVKVGNNPAAVAVLYDGSRAYTANQADGTVTVVNLTSHTVEKTIGVVGYPRSIVSTQNSETAKVYVSSPNSDYITVINAETDLVDTTLLMNGLVVDIHTTTQNGTSTNDNPVSRRPGYGQPCYMPGSTYTASLSACQTLPFSSN